MGTTTTTFALNKPTVGGDDNAWGTDLNANADKLDDLLDGTTAIKPNLSEGLWKVGGVAVTSTAAELNVLDGIPGTLTATELGYVDGVTSAIQTQLDGKQALDADLTAIAGLSSNGLVARTGAGTAAARTITGTSNQITVTDGDGSAGNPTIAAVVASQAEAEAGADTTKLMTPQRVSQAITALVPASTVFLGTITTTSGTSQTLSGLTLTPYKFLICSFNGVSLSSTGDITITTNASGRIVASTSSSAHNINGLVTIDLATGGFTAVTSDSGSTGSRLATSGVSGLTTASTSVTFLGASFDAGSIRVYGVR